MLPTNQKPQKTSSIVDFQEGTAPRSDGKTTSINSTPLISRNTKSILSTEKHFQKGMFYQYGSDDPKNPDPTKIDYAKAVKYLTLAAEQKDVKAQYALGIYYSDGTTSGNASNPEHIDYALAVKYWTLAAKQEDAWAQYNLGICYSDGTTSGKVSDPEHIDYALAVKYLTLAAEQEDAEAQYALGICYINGQTSGKVSDPEHIDYAKAGFYFRKAYLSSDSTLQLKVISFFNTELNLPSINQETRTFLRYHLNIINNPDFIRNTIAKDPLDDAEIKKIIKGLTCYETKCLQIYYYLLEIIKKNTDYFHTIMSCMSSEDKNAFAAYLATSEIIFLRFLTMRAIIKDPNTSLYLRLDTEFNLNYELMNLEINALVIASGMNRDTFFKTKAGFEDYQTYYKIFMPKIRKCTRKAIEANSSGIDSIEELKQSFLYKLQGFETAYEKYKAAAKTSN